MTRHLFTGILALVFLITGCTAPSPQVTLVPPTAEPRTPSLSPPTTTPVSPTSDAAPPPTSTSLSPSPSPAPTIGPLPHPGDYTWAIIAWGLSHPTDIAGAADGSNRLFVLEQPGRIRIILNDQLQPAPFLDITDRVGSGSSEQGLLGLAFHPQFAQNGYLYVNYTDRNGDTRISRFTAQGDQADSHSEKRLLAVKQPFANHNGGALHFGPEGYLYIALGDGGSQGDPYENGQSGSTLLGKILRIDVNRDDPYDIPADNPFVNTSGVYPEIWAFGLRNPWRFSFDPQTGDIWIGDVGQNSQEEINRAASGAPGGLNFGWSQVEGSQPYKGSHQPDYTAPVAEYTHAAGCSISGGYVYRGQALPEWQGVYFFGDYCSGSVWGLSAAAAASNPPVAITPLFETDLNISTFGIDDAGELYLADHTSGTIYRLSKN